MQHVINKLRINLRCPDESLALTLRKSFQNNFYKRVISVIEKYLDEESDAQQLIEIDKIEINLKSFPASGFDTEDYLKRLDKEFKQQFSAALATSAVKEKLFPSAVNALTTFLSTGDIPWWTDEKEANPDDWCNQIETSTEGSNFIAWLTNNYQHQEIWDRITTQLTPRIKSYIINAIPELAKAVKNLTTILKQPENSAIPALSEKFIHEDTINDFILSSGSKLLAAIPAENAEHLLYSYLTTVYSKTTIENLPAGLGQMIQDVQQSGVNKENNSDLTVRNRPEKARKEKIRTNRAGIVLLAVFLKEFFQRMGLWYNGKWVNKYAPGRAVYLLNYLSTGEEFFFEYHLTLEKILCGIHPEEALIEKVHLTSEEKAGVTELLASVIEHWDALKNTSINGLRNSFLMRDGLISAHQKDWLLQIETRTMDILLNQIPWSFRTIILPWAPYTIYTEW